MRQLLRLFYNHFLPVHDIDSYAHCHSGLAGREWQHKSCRITYPFPLGRLGWVKKADELAPFMSTRLSVQRDLSYNHLVALRANLHDYHLARLGIQSGDAVSGVCAVEQLAVER